MQYRVKYAKVKRSIFNFTPTKIPIRINSSGQIMEPNMQNSIWIDLKSGKQRKEPVSEAVFLTGGRALSSDIIAKHVPAGANPLGPFNVITFCCGILAGTTISNANRLSVGSKSPLTV
jgi:aldehyde:ferredoxin oxidoreductase